jgi:hypothetical protein
LGPSSGPVRTAGRIDRDRSETPIEVRTRRPSCDD